MGRTAEVPEHEDSPAKHNDTNSKEQGPGHTGRIAVPKGAAVRGSMIRYLYPRSTLWLIYTTRIAQYPQQLAAHSRHPLPAQHRRARSALYFYTYAPLPASNATLKLGSWLPLPKSFRKPDLPLSKRACRLVCALSNPGRVVALAHPVHLAYGLKTRYFLK